MRSFPSTADACTVTTVKCACHWLGTCKGVFPEQYMQSIFDRCAHALQVSSAADLQHAANVCQIGWSASGTWLAVATEDGKDESLEAEPSRQLEAGVKLFMRGPWQLGHGGLSQQSMCFMSL